LQILRSFVGLKIVGADIAGVSPPLDTISRMTCITAAQLALEMICIIQIVRLSNRKQTRQEFIKSFCNSRGLNVNSLLGPLSLLMIRHTKTLSEIPFS
jgi:hypothetical protein